MRWRYLGLFGFLCIALFQSETEALPAQRRLFKETYQYAVSCVLCHGTGGGSALTKYGKDFLRNGASIAALRRIETLDSDHDGLSNLKEILAKSNPGDPLSIPEKPGKWLENIEADAIPIEALKKGFKQSEGFTVLEGVLKPTQIQELQKRLGEPLLDEDKVPVFYFAVKKTNGKLTKYGVAQFTRQTPFTLLVGIHLNGTISFVELVKAADDALAKEGAFWDQFAGKSVGDSFKVGDGIVPIPQKNALSQEIATAVYKNLLIVTTVFSGGK